MRIMITGPTASGKTSLSIKLAKEIDAEIVSVDSRQCYKLLDIGTAKPSPQELQEIPHHNISVLDLTEEDSAAAFKIRSNEYTKSIESRGKSVIYCGGSTLHLQSIIRPLDDIPSSNEDNIREFNQIADEMGLEILYQKLKEKDPEYAKKMDGLNRQRIIRALDVINQTGMPFSSFHSDSPIRLPDNLIVFILEHPRHILHQKISERTENMIQNGLLDETRMILGQGYDRNLQALQTVGYREAISCLDGDTDLEKMIEDIKTSTRRYAKRQITWFRRWPFVHTLKADKFTQVQLVNEVLQKVAANSKNR